MHLGIDVGTSSVKAIIIDNQQQIIAHSSHPLELSTPHPLWSEQDPNTYLQAAVSAIRKLTTEIKPNVQSIGLSGQMHTAIMLNKNHEPIRPAILWNDGRAHLECIELQKRYPNWESIFSNPLMPGFTAPKMAWMQQHEPKHFEQISKILLPKDFLRLNLCNEFVTDASDASGMGWLDTQHRQWSPELVKASHLSLNQLPSVIEGTQISGYLSQHAAQRLGLKSGIPIIAGAGDNAASAVSSAVLAPGTSFISLGTSGVYFTAINAFQKPLESGIHTFCHCIPNHWHLMGVHLNATNCLNWLSDLFNMSIEALISEGDKLESWQSSLLFLPYLCGERTPYNNSKATGILKGITPITSRAHITIAVLCGVALSLKLSQDGMHNAIDNNQPIILLGGGSQSQLWCKIIASALNRDLKIITNYHHGAALGAAKLAWCGYHNADPKTDLLPPLFEDHITPSQKMMDYLETQYPQFKTLYSTLEPNFF